MRLLHRIVFVVAASWMVFYGTDLLSLLHAEEEESPLRPAEEISFWEVGLADFEADRPRAISIPDTAGYLGYYWYWTFKFQVKTNLDRVREDLQEVLPRINNDEEKDNLSEVLKTIERASGQEKRARLSIMLHTDTGQAVADLSNSTLRNFIERKLRYPPGSLHTVREIANKTLKDGETIEGVAIFPDFDKQARVIEIRVYGLGNRIVPTYEPGSLLYTYYLPADNRLDPSLRRAFRFSYRRFGQSGEAYLDPIQLEWKKCDWIWLWSTQIFAQSCRFVTVKRHSGLEREYAYIPYKVWNNTNTPQPFEVRKASLIVRIDWRGERIALQMEDIGTADSYWKTQALQAITERVEKDEEAAIVEERELIKYGDVHEEVTARVAEDKALKAKILPTSEERHVRGELTPGNYALGLIIVRWGVEDIEASIRPLIQRLRLRAITRPRENGENTPEPSPLQKSYHELRTPTEEKATWLQPPEPTDEQVKEMLVKLASEDLQAKGVEPSEDEKQRYGSLAPLGALWNLLAKEMLEKRMAGEDNQIGGPDGMIDTYYEVVWDKVIDQATIPTQFANLLPKPRQPFVKPKVTIRGEAPAEAKEGEEAAPSW